MFTIRHTQGLARRGELETRHGTIQTPAFLPCATHGSVRGLERDALTHDALLVNAYHLYLRPGIDRIEKLGGLHTFMGWKNAILTDSGGFQAFALSKFARFSEEGIRFTSHLDGSRHQFTPELVVDIQQKLGVDIATCLDVCTGFPVPEQKVADAVDQTNRWAERSVTAWKDKEMLLYGMVQGSIYPEQRRRSAAFLRDLPFSGFAIGGNMYTFGQRIDELAEEKPKMWQIVELTTQELPESKPRHLLGVGEPSDIIAGVRAGIDTFDCVMATRIARHGAVWIRNGEPSWAYRRENLTAATWANSVKSIDELCACATCEAGHSRAYIHHLLKERDPAAGRLLTIHNLHFLAELTRAIRESIESGTFDQLFPAA